MNRCIGLIYKAFVRVTKRNKHYMYRCKGSKKWAYISYIPEVFYKQWDECYMRGHQSRQEMVEIVKIFNRLGYNVFVSSCNYPILPNRSFDIVFGVEPAFVAACNKYPNSKKIYYATGAFWGHQNGMIKQRTDFFNESHDSCLAYTRVVKVYNHLDLCDAIIQIGSEYTIDTYPEKYKHKIFLIHQSTTMSAVDVPSISYSSENEYIWIGGGGAILKGLDLVLEYFIKHPEKKLHVVGIVEEDFFKVYEPQIGTNISFHGYMNLASKEFREIMSKCNVMIYPSCTEGGCPGAVINAMFYGLIPVVSRWAGTKEINDLGVILKDLTLDSISSAITTLEGMDCEKLQSMKQSCHNYIKETFNINRFSSEFEEYIRKFLV